MQDDSRSIMNLKQVEFLEKLDKIFNAFLSNSKMMQLSQRDYDFAKDLLDSHHLIVAPDIPRGKVNKLIQELIGCTYPKAKRIIDAHYLLWGDAKQNNLEFKRLLICNKILKFAEDAEKEGDNDRAAELYEKYYNMMKLGDMEQARTPRKLPTVVVLKNNAKLLEIEEAEVDE